MFNQEEGDACMKVKYIKESNISLTKDQIYEVISVEKGCYRIIDDTLEDYLFSPEDFEIIEYEKNEDFLTADAIKFIIKRVIQNALDTAEEAKENNDDFNKGRKLAYYEILDTIKNELIIREADLKEFSLDIDLENEFI
jgi:hypothetical protein